MNIPDCYDPAIQEEWRQLMEDRALTSLPICDCCLKRMHPGEIYHPFTVRKVPCIMCSDCKGFLDDNGEIVEE